MPADCVDMKINKLVNKHTGAQTVKEVVLLCGDIPLVSYCLNTPLPIKAITMESVRLSILLLKDERAKCSGKG